jgi:enoyl-CoA hydratase/carnithine racemase
VLRLEFIGSLAIVTLCRPSVNAMNFVWTERLAQVLDEVESSEVGVLLVRSDQRVFSAGADINELAALSVADERDAIRLAGALQDVFRRLEHMQPVSIAEMGGAALGGDSNSHSPAICASRRPHAEWASLKRDSASCRLPAVLSA